MKIMIVDDHADMRRVLRSIVSFSAVKPTEIIECESGEAAVGKYIVHHPDCVLMDVELKDMNGFEATERIYTQDSNANVVIVTSYDTPAFRARAERLHVKGFISKDKLSDIKQILQNITYNRGT